MHEALWKLAALLVVGAASALIFVAGWGWWRPQPPIPQEKTERPQRGLLQDEKRAEREVAIDIPWTQFRVSKIHRWHGVSDVDEYIVTCTAPATRSAPGGRKDFIPSGSVLVARISYIDVRSGPGQDDLTAAAALVRTSIRSGPGWISWTHRDLRVSLDGCASWIEFQPTRLLEPRLMGSEKGTCATPECARLAIHNNGVFFSDIKAERNAAGGRVSFVMNSTGFAIPGSMTLGTEDGGRSWRVIGRGAPSDAFQPDVSRYVNQKPEPPKLTPQQMHALTPEEFAAIPRPPLRGPQHLLFGRIREDALAGRRDGVRKARIKDLNTRKGEPMEDFRAAVLAAMDEKAARLSAPPVSPPASPYALTEAELMQVTPPRLEGPTMTMLIADIQAAARAGNQSRVMSLSMEATRDGEREAIDRYAAALLDAMVGKAAKQ